MNAMRPILRTACILLILFGLTCVPARAQLRAVPDERGSVVFVNDGPVAPAKTAKVTATPAAPAKVVGIAESSTPTSPRPTTPQEIDQIVQSTAEKHRV